MNEKNEEKIEHAETELRPVRKKYRRIIRIGSTLAVGGAIIAVVASLSSPRELMGAPASSMIKLEQRQAEIKEVIRQEKAAKPSEIELTQQKDR